MEEPRFWTEDERKITWCIITFSRRGLKLAISPCITSAFYLLHKYYADPEREPADLYLLVISALFLSCKIEDTWRPLAMIFREFFQMHITSSEKVGAQAIIQTLGNRNYNDPSVTDDEARLICQYENIFLNLIRWNLNIDSPFKHFNENRSVFAEIENDNIANSDNYFNCVLRDLCLLIRSEYYLSIPPIISAAASMLHSYQGKDLPEKAKEWISELKSSYPKEFQCAFDVLATESKQCVPFSCQ